MQGNDPKTDSARDKRAARQQQEPVLRLPQLMIDAIHAGRLTQVRIPIMHGRVTLQETLIARNTTVVRLSFEPDSYAAKRGRAVSRWRCRLADSSEIILNGPVPGGRLWVPEDHYLFGKWKVSVARGSSRRAWHFESAPDMGVCFEYPNGLITGRATEVSGWHERPAHFMPRWAARLLLDVSAVRHQPLQEVDADDLKASGVRGMEKTLAGGTDEMLSDSELEAAMLLKPGLAFQKLMELQHGAALWAANPLVWVVDVSPRLVTPGLVDRAQEH